jgi:hypothetical protein
LEAPPTLRQRQSAVPGEVTEIGIATDQRDVVVDAGLGYQDGCYLAFNR